MTRSRLVAAVAALAVGFGITLVGTTVADSDDGASRADVVVETTDPNGQGGAVDDDANQEVVEADEPDAATLETEPVATEPAAAEPAVPETTIDTVAPPESEGSDDRPVPGDSEETSGPDADREPNEPLPDADRGDVPEDCFDVIVIEDDLNGDVVLRKGLEYQLVDGEVTLLIDVGLDDRQLAGADEVSITVVDGDIFFCADGSEVDDVVYDWFYAAPCDDDVRGYFEDFFSTLDVSDEGPAFSDEEVFIVVVAERIERFNPNTDRFDEFFDEVSETFAGFPDDCSPTVLDAELASQEFFCAAGNLSATDDLLGYLSGVLGLALPGCGYDA